MLVGMDSGEVTFVERGGSGAREALRELRDRLVSAGTSARLLVSRDDDSLYLLVVEGGPAVEPSLERTGGRTWRFREVDADGGRHVDPA